MAQKLNLSVTSRGLKYKLRIAVSLMSILPLLVCMYLVSRYVLPKTGINIDVTLLVMISIFIALTGFFVIKQIFDRILAVTNDAKLIVAGDLSRKVEIAREDEVGDLGDALNQLTMRIRSNMDELKSYGDKTTEINLEIQKRVLVLSSLLQISSLISQSAKLDDILKITIEKGRLLANSDIAYLLFRDEGERGFHMRVADGLNSQYLFSVKVTEEQGAFARLIRTNKPLILDKQNNLSENLVKDFNEKFKLKNTLALPIFIRGKMSGIIGIGNNKEQFLYRKDDAELLDIFAKQVAIAVENDILMHKVEKLEIKDALTGLYNETYIRTHLQEEIKRAIAYQRPCSFILFNIDNFQEFHNNFGSLQTESAIKKAASLIKDSVSEINKVARFGDDGFAVLLPEKNKRQAQEIAEEMRKKIEFTFSEEPDAKRRLTVSGGVSENPLDGIDADELIVKAKELLSFAKQQGRNRVVGLEKTVCQ